MEIQSDTLKFSRLTIPNAKNKSDFLEMHTHDFYEFIFLESGDADYVVEGRRYKLQKNDLIFTRPLTYHYIEMRSNADYKRCLIGCKDIVLDKSLLQRIPDNLEVLHCPEHSIISQNFERLIYYANALEKEDFFDLFPSILKEILYNIYLSKNDVVHIPAEISPALSNILLYINENLFFINDVEEIANALFLSEAYIFKLFKSQLKISPKKYIQLKRLHHAKQMLASGKKPIEIYRECGFHSYVGFYKQFVKQFGYPPSQENS
jgi:AraC-like DNA-binding protein